MENGDKVVFGTTGALPTGLTVGTTYYVVSKATNTFQVAATVGGTPINTTGTQSGTHSGIHAPWGRGDGITTFNIPDFRGRVLVGVENIGGTAAGLITSSSTDGANAVSLSGVGGAQTHTLVTSEMPAHTHTQNGTNDGSDSGVVHLLTGFDFNVATETNWGQTDSTGGGGAHSNTQPWITVNYIIKY
jgi:microcystin-dependent protein